MPKLNLTLEDLAMMITKLHQELRDQREFNRVLIVLMAQHGDPTHLTIENFARIKGVSVKTVRRRIAAGQYRLEQIPGTRKTGIPVEQAYADWIDLAEARRAVSRQREQLIREEPTDDKTFGC